MRNLFDQAGHNLEEQGLLALGQPGAGPPEVRHQIGIRDHEAIEPNTHLEDRIVSHGFRHRVHLIVAIEVQLDRAAAVALLPASGRDEFRHQHRCSPCYKLRAI